MDTPESDPLRLLRPPSDPWLYHIQPTSPEQTPSIKPRVQSFSAELLPLLDSWLSEDEESNREASAMALGVTPFLPQPPPPFPPPPPPAQGAPPRSRKLPRYVSAPCLLENSFRGSTFGSGVERERERDFRDGPALKYWDASQDRGRKKEKKNVSLCCGRNSSRVDDAGEPHGTHIK